MKDREISYGLTERAAAAGFDTLFFTVDTPLRELDYVISATVSPSRRS